MTLLLARRPRLPEWAGAGLTTLLTITVTAISLIGIVIANDRPAIEPPPAPLPKMRLQRFELPAAEGAVIFIVSGAEETARLNEALANERLVRQLANEPFRLRWVIDGEGLDVDLVRQLIVSDDIRLATPPTTLVDLR